MRSESEGGIRCGLESSVIGVLVCFDFRSEKVSLAGFIFASLGLCVPNCSLRQMTAKYFLFSQSVRFQFNVNP